MVFEEITKGVFREESRAAYVEVMRDLRARGGDAVVLACTEIGLLVDAARAPLPVVDSAVAHASLLVDLALEPEPVPGGVGAPERVAAVGRA